MHTEIDRIVGQAHDAGLTMDRDILQKPHLNTPSKKVLALRSKLEAGALT